MLKQTVMVAVLFAACGQVTFPGAPVIGASCAARDGECVTPDEIAYCESGKWVSYACPTECRNLQGNRCGWRTMKEGEPCSMDGLAVCAENSANLISCVKGKVVVTACTANCRPSNDPRGAACET